MQLILSARESRRRGLFTWTAMSSPAFIYLTNSCLGPGRLYFLNLLQGSLAWTLVGTIHGVGGRLQMWESHLKGFMEKGDHRPSETLIVIYGWVCEKGAGGRCRSRLYKQTGHCCDSVICSAPGFMHVMVPCGS